MRVPGVVRWREELRARLQPADTGATGRGRGRGRTRGTPRGTARRERRRRDDDHRGDQQRCLEGTSHGTSHWLNPFNSSRDDIGTMWPPPYGRPWGRGAASTGGGP